MCLQEFKKASRTTHLPGRRLNREPQEESQDANHDGFDIELRRGVSKSQVS
jgi:hypothetical protein